MRVRMLDGSGYRDYRYLVEDVDRHGNIRIYFRLKKGQPKIRLKALPGTDEFDKEYRRALTAKLRPPAEAASAGDNLGGPAKPGTLRWLCQQYLASSLFNGLAGSTRRMWRVTRPAIRSAQRHGWPSICCSIPGYAAATSSGSVRRWSAGLARPCPTAVRRKFKSLFSPRRRVANASSSGTNCRSCPRYDAASTRRRSYIWFI